MKTGPCYNRHVLSLKPTLFLLKREIGTCWKGVRHGDTSAWDFLPEVIRAERTRRRAMSLDAVSMCHPSVGPVSPARGPRLGTAALDL